MVDKNLYVPEFVVNISNNILMEINKFGEVLYANDKAKCVFGGINLNKNLKSCLSDNDWFVLFKNIENVLYNQHQHHFYWDYKNRFYIVYVYPHNTSVWRGFEDVREKRQLSHLLHINSLRTTFGEKISKSGYWELDLSKKRFYWSAGMYKLFEIDDDYTSYKKNLIRDLILPQDMGLYKKELKKLLKDKQDVCGFIRILTKKNKIKKCRFGAGIFYENGEEKVAGVFVDVSDCMADNCEKCTYLSENFSCMLAKVIHDLRQPVTAMKLLIGDIENEVSDKGRNYLLKLDNICENLNYLIEGSMNIAKNKNIDGEKFDIKNVVEKICDEYLKKIEQKNAKLILKLKKYEVYQNLFLTEKIIRNILDNAVKFTKSKILIKNVGGCIIIADDGCGVDKNEQKQIFADFFQCDGLSDKNSKGAGLGLGIVNYSSWLIGAKIKIKSRKKYYTAFKVCL